MKKNNLLKPTGALLNITTICPHKCVYCYPQKESILKPANMTLDAFRKISATLSKEKFKRVYLYLIGEPWMNPNFYDFMEICCEHGFETNVATKAAVPVDWPRLTEIQTAFNESSGKLLWLVEVPAWSQSSADHICTINLEGQKENLRIFGEMDKSRKYKNVSWRITTIATKWNEKELAEIKNGLLKFGLKSWKIKRPGYFIEKPVNQGWLPSSAYSRKLTSQRKKCPFPKNVAINFNGDVSVCCHDMLFQNTIGNILEEKTLNGIISANQKTMKDRLSMKLKICGRCN